MTITDKQRAFLTKSGVSVAYNMSSEEASKLIGEIINKGKPKEVVQEQQKAYENKVADSNNSFRIGDTMHLTVALLEHQAVLVQAKLIAVEHMSDVGTLMAQSILCIKQAQKEFQ